MSPTNRLLLIQKDEEPQELFRRTPQPNDRNRTSDTEQGCGKPKKRKEAVDRNPNRTEPIGPKSETAHPTLDSVSMGI